MAVRHVMRKENKYIYIYIYMAVRHVMRKEDNIPTTKMYEAIS